MDVIGSNVTVTLNKIKYIYIIRTFFQFCSLLCPNMWHMYWRGFFMYNSNSLFFVQTLNMCSINVIRRPNKITYLNGLFSSTFSPQFGVIGFFWARVINDQILFFLSFIQQKKKKKFLFFLFEPNNVVHPFFLSFFFILPTFHPKQ